MLIRSDLRCKLNVDGKDEFYLDTRIIPKEDIVENDNGIQGYEAGEYWYSLSLDEMHEDVPDVYLLKQVDEVEYVPASFYREYQCPVFDIDDFGDCDEGWDDFIEATEEESDFYQQSVHEVFYIVAYVKNNTLVHEKNLIKYIESTMLKANKVFLDSVK